MAGKRKVGWAVRSRPARTGTALRDPLSPSAGGSPPRARGQRISCPLRQGNFGFTPACAGTATCGLVGPVHPRVRGDRLFRSEFDTDDDGSPPRARGQQVSGVVPMSPSRFTPACAGTAGGSRSAAPCSAVHPRVRGDSMGAEPVTQSTCGSPPRARGQGFGCGELGASGRFTPACAGTGPPARLRWSPFSVHPRVRGDRPGVAGACDRNVGSPPRARGQDAAHDVPGLHFRFTPACAGTGRGRMARGYSVPVHPRVRGDRDESGGISLRSAVHPRVRGDSVFPAHCGKGISGSPPRARGQRLAGLWGRFTPACAGTGWSHPPRPSRRTVHPRVRGDRVSSSWRLTLNRGSPPRARGQVRCVFVVLLNGRFTPACAGTGEGEAAGL